ncbi:hypothetical protein [Fictibacillus sp. NRS-1165]|uniref:hypothetical protein n=1 Tax=Fictibacillus sp. NRS-1165 TaxID=3144463 RepID=UPI003D1A4F9C
MQRQIKRFISDLEDKRELLEKNVFNLGDFHPKEMPLAIYDYVILNLKNMIERDEK